MLWELLLISCLFIIITPVITTPISNEIYENLNKSQLFEKYNSNELNSIDLSYNIYLNKLYLNACTNLQNQVKDKKDCQCCSGNIENLNCETKSKCTEINYRLKKRILILTLSIYSSLLLIFSFGFGFVIWILSRQIKSSFTAKMNGIYTFTLILCSGLILPGLFLALIKIFGDIDFQKCFRADFCGLTNKYVLSIETIDEDKRIKKVDENYLSSNTNRPVNLDKDLNNNNKPVPKMNIELSES